MPAPLAPGLRLVDVLHSRSNDGLGSTAQCVQHVELLVLPMRKIGAGGHWQAV